MYDENLQRLALIKDKIEKIAQICEFGIVKALDDEVCNRPAILMHLVACNEQLQKLQDNGFDTLAVFNAREIRGLRGVRNFIAHDIAHDYEGVNLAMIETMIRDYLPSIRESVTNYLAKSSLNDCDNLNEASQVQKRKFPK